MDTREPSVWIAIASRRLRKALLAAVGPSERSFCVVLESGHPSQASRFPALIVSDAAQAGSMADLGAPVVVIVGEAGTAQGLPEACVVVRAGGLRTAAALISLAVKSSAGPAGESELRLGGLDKHIPGAIYTCDVSAGWSVLRISDGVEGLCGRPASAFLDGSVRWSALIHATDLESVDAAIEAALVEGRPYEIEYRIVHSDGSVRWVADRGRLTPEGDGGSRLATGVALDVTERKRAEANAREAMNLMETALGASPVGLVTFKASGPLVWANDEIARIVGGTLPELYEQNFRTLKSWKDAGLLALAEEALESWTPREGEIDGLTTFGRHWMVHARLVPFTFNEERHVLLVAEDVTGRKQAEEALRASEAKLAQVFRVIPDAIVISKPETGEVLDVNEAFERLFGYSRSEILGKTTDEVSLWASADDRVRYVQRYRKEGCVRSQEAVLRDRHGREFWAELSSDPIELGGTSWALSVARDISGRRQAVEALNAGERFLRESQRAGRIGSFELDVASGIWRCSEAMDEMLEIDSAYPHTVEGWIALVHPDDRQTMADYYAKFVLGSRKPFDREYRIQTPRNARVKWVHGLGRLDLDDLREPRRLIGTIQDVTERKQAEEALVEARDELERRVVLRTAQLEAANKEQESFSYSVSHDLRGPLRAMDGYSRILLADHAGGLDDEGKAYIVRIIEAAGRMGQLVDDLLRLSRINRTELKTEDVDLSALATEIVRKLQESEPDRKVALAIEPGIAVAGDAALLSALLENLLGNAWKYTGKHEQAHIQFGIIRESGKFAYFVKDDGAGFDAAYADSLFAPFHRLHHEADYPGTGIGLATARRIVERHGGKIWAEGAVERGATFYFTLGAYTGGAADP